MSSACTAAPCAVWRRFRWLVGCATRRVAKTMIQESPLATERTQSDRAYSPLSRRNPPTPTPPLRRPPSPASFPFLRPTHHRACRYVYSWPPLASSGSSRGGSGPMIAGGRCWSQLGAGARSLPTAGLQRLTYTVKTYVQIDYILIDISVNSFYTKYFMVDKTSRLN